MSDVLKVLGKNIALYPTDLRIRALNCIENLLRIQLGEQNNQICSLTENWYKQLHADPIHLIMNYAKNPFVDIRLAGLSVVQAIAEQTWGQEVIKNIPGKI